MDRLIVDGNGYKYRVCWLLAEDGDIGAMLGDLPQCDYDKSDEHGVATRAAAATSGCLQDGFGFYWESRSRAEAARRTANAALKNRPLDDWEQKALAAGWKPPRGRM